MHERRFRSLGIWRKRGVDLKTALKGKESGRRLRRPDNSNRKEVGIVVSFICLQCVRSAKSSVRHSSALLPLQYVKGLNSEIFFCGEELVPDKNVLKFRYVSSPLKLWSCKSLMIFCFPLSEMRHLMMWIFLPLSTPDRRRQVSRLFFLVTRRQRRRRRTDR